MLPDRSFISVSPPPSSEGLNRWSKSAESARSAVWHSGTTLRTAYGLLMRVSTGRVRQGGCASPARWWLTVIASAFSSSAEASNAAVHSFPKLPPGCHLNSARHRVICFVNQVGGLYMAAAAGTDRFTPHLWFEFSRSYFFMQTSPGFHCKHSMATDVCKLCKNKHFAGFNWNNSNKKNARKVLIIITGKILYNSSLGPWLNERRR